MNPIIEKEIQKIDDSYKKVIAQIDVYYKEQHLILLQKEKKIKNELYEKVLRKKEELKNYSKKSNQLILSCEKIEKSIKNYETKNTFNNSEIKTLYFLSEIHNYYQKGSDLINEPITNYDLEFNQSLFSRVLFYNEYYFNGIPIPSNIKVEKDNDDKIIISWNIDKIKIPDFDINKLKYQIELFNGEFNINTYEANKTSLVLEKLNLDIQYKVNIRANINGKLGKFSETNYFKVNELENKEKVSIFRNIGNPYEIKGSIFGNNGSLFSNNTSNSTSLFSNKIFNNYC